MNALVLNWIRSELNTGHVYYFPNVGISIKYHVPEYKYNINISIFPKSMSLLYFNLDDILLGSTDVFLFDIDANEYVFKSEEQRKKLRQSLIKITMINKIYRIKKLIDNKIISYEQ